MRILGVSAFYHDSAAALTDDGRLVAAAQEERFTRRKHDAGFPAQAVAFCLAEAGLRLADVDYVVFYDKPLLKFERLLKTYLAFAPEGFPSFRRAMPVWLREKLFQKSLLHRELTEFDPDFDARTRLLFTEHHQAHAASAFYPSPFREAAILTMDGVGEWATTSVGVGSGNRLEIQREIRFPHSLGLLYSAFTSYLGFKVNSGEYKVMGLAPYGEPRYAGRIRDALVDVKPDGSFRLDMAYFAYCTGLVMTNDRFDGLFGGPRRLPEAPLDQRHMDLAASIQAVTEDIVLRMGRSLARESGRKNLCLAGGVALNCVANGKLLREGCFDDIWVQPAAGDAGGAVGAALAVHHGYAGGLREPDGVHDGMRGSYLGPGYSDTEVERRLDALGARYDVLGEDDLIDRVARACAAGKAVGWFQGRMEFGPRALGNRSILADPRALDMQQTLNLKVKFRESFRPFAPSCLSAEVSDWFELDRESPYMLFVADVAPAHRRSPADGDTVTGLDRLAVARSDIPAVTHVDHSARIQTVNPETNPRYHALIRRFKALTGYPVLVNTSFNVRGEPIVCTPEDAFRCFMGTELDLLAIGTCLLDKAQQPSELKRDHAVSFELD